MGGQIEAAIPSLLTPVIACVVVLLQSAMPVVPRKTKDTVAATVASSSGATSAQSKKDE
jgi:hypothetical protein